MVKIETRCRIPIWQTFARIPWHVIPEPLPHCRVLPLGEFTAMIPVPHATLQGAVTWRNQCHDRATLHGVIILSAILKIVFGHILFFGFFNAVWALTSGSFRIVYDTLVTIDLQRLTCRYNVSRFSGEDKRKLISVRQKMRRQYGITRSHGTGHTTEWPCDSVDSTESHGHTVLVTLPSDRVIPYCRRIFCLTDTTPHLS